MIEQVKKILAEALELSPVERAALVEGLLSSSDFPPRRDVDDLWFKVAEERIDAYDRGDLKASPIEVILDRLEKSPMG